MESARNIGEASISSLQGKVSSPKICIPKTGLNLEIFPLLEGLSVDELRFFINLANGHELDIAAKKVNMSRKKARESWNAIKKRFRVESLEEMRRRIFL